MSDLSNKFHNEPWFFKFVMEQIDYSVIVTDLDLKITYANKAAEELFGYTRKELLGKNPDMFNAEPDADEIQKDIFKTISNGKTWEKRIHNVRKNGECFFTDIIISSIHNERNEIIAFIGFQRDVSEIKISQDKYSSIFQNAPRLIVLVYEDGTLKDCNDRIFNFLGYTKEEVVGKNVKMFYKEEYFEKLDASLKSIINGNELLDEEFEMIKKSGEKIYVTIKSSMTIDEEGRKHTICFIADITKQKETQMQAQQSALELKKSNEELEEFAYVASHDLQEPLRVVSSYCQLLKEKREEYLGGYPSDENVDKYFDYVIDATFRMRTLIKDLLDFSRVGKREEHFEKIKLEKLLEEVLLDFEVSINEVGANIKIGNEKIGFPVIYGIFFRIKQLFQNLISNAIKFRGDDKLIIEIGCCEEKNNWLFHIRDNGLGIQSKYFEKVFGIFKRLYPRENYPGTGIGLALCKRIVETHGGKIWIDSDGATGTCVYFTIAKPINLNIKKRESK